MIGTYNEILELHNDFKKFIKSDEQKSTNDRETPLFTSQNSSVNENFDEKDQLLPHDAEETIQTGRVNPLVLIKYLRSTHGGLFLVFLIFTVFTVSESFTLVFNNLVASWSEADKYRYHSSHFNCTGQQRAPIDRINGLTVDEWRSEKQQNYYNLCSMYFLLS